jgi:hypothetical protein
MAYPKDDASHSYCGCIQIHEHFVDFNVLAPAALLIGEDSKRFLITFIPHQVAPTQEEAE